MSLSAKHGRFFRFEPLTATTPVGADASLDGGDDVVVISESMRIHYNADAGLATIQSLVQSAEHRAAEIIAAAEAQAASIVRDANNRAESVRSAAYNDGFQSGEAEGLDSARDELEGLVAIARAACVNGVAIRDQVASSSTVLLADAVALATRRIVAEWYDAEPAHTAAICVEALRAASGQDILSLRVNPSLAGHVQASVGASAKYVRPDESVAIGGCIIDLAGGTIDASLDTRLSLLELGLQRASGGAE